MKELLQSLSPNERKILSFLDLPYDSIKKKTKLDDTTLMHTLRFLEQKKILVLEIQKKEKIELGVNGLLYKKRGLPERQLVSLLEQEKRITLEELGKKIKLSENELHAALGALKRKELITIEKGKVILAGKKELIINQWPEEKVLAALPKLKNTLNLEEKKGYDLLKSRRDIVQEEEEKEVQIKVTEIGRKLMLETLDENLIEELTPDIIKRGGQGLQFRRYTVTSPVPPVYGGKTHFTTQAREFARTLWLQMGFSEMEGPMIDNGFWVFDALFTAQDHPVREMQDTFYLETESSGEIKKELKEAIKKAHEQGVAGSKGLGYTWNEAESKKKILRTHTTSLSARMLASIDVNKLPAKYFAVGKVFRNETIDWSHGIEFYQTEGIVVDENANLQQLLGYLQEFYRKMGFKKIRVRPSFFPYTEPSLEIDVFHAERNQWLELGGAGIFRPEVTQPLLGKAIPVLAWGQGLDRMIMDAYEIKDLRELYANNLSHLRKKKYWMHHNG